MNNNSPVTELLIESFDQLLDNKHISLKYNTLIQLSILFMILIKFKYSTLVLKLFNKHLIIV